MPNDRVLTSVRRSLHCLTLVAALAATATACGTSSSSTASSPSTSSSSSTVDSKATPSATTTVHIEDYAFSPDKVTVTAGSKITFVNDDAVNHTATASDGAVDAGTIGPGESKTITVEAPAGGPGATIPYICEIHPIMQGSITVEP